MSTIIGYVFLCAAGLIYLGMLFCYMAVMDRKAKQKQPAKPVVQTSFACLDRDKHGVPWPVLSVDGMLVGWLCGTCLEKRDDFTCPPIRYRVVCEHPEWEEVRTWGAGIVQRYCRDCGQQQMFTEQLEAHFREEGHNVPFVPLLHTHQGE